MTPPTSQDIRALIASPCLIQQDRAGRALFISDFHKRIPDADKARMRLIAAGYICTETGGMCLIDWARESYAAFYEALPVLPLPALTDENAPLWGLCSILARHSAPLDRQDIGVLAQALRWARLNEKAKLPDLIGSSLAEALREGKAPPRHAAGLLSAIINEHDQLFQGGTPC